MKNLSPSLLATLFLGASSAALAQQMPPLYAPTKTPWYFGAGAGVGNLNRSPGELTGLNNANLDDSDTAYTVRGGFRFSPYGAVELGYYDFGRYNFNGTLLGNVVPVNGSVKAQSVGISLVAILPINNFDIYGRIGYARSELKFNANGRLATADEKDKQNEATYGVGARWTFAPNWALFAEWFKNDKIRVDGYVGGVDFRF
jgi:OOP family OmpA-OmpF porin